MTAATASSVSAPVETGRAKGSFSGALWLAWRQHRLAIVVTTIGIAALSGQLYWDSTDVAHSNSATVLATVVVPATAGLIAIFWGAPLLPREYEQRTNLLVWSQDLSVGRWLLGKIVLLAPVLLLLWAVLGTAAGILAHRDWMQYPSIDAFASAPFGFIGNQFAPFGSIGFEAWVPLQLGYVLFGFALGLLVGAIVRRTMVSVAVTLALFTAVRLVIAVLARPYFLTPVRYLSAPESPAGVWAAAAAQDPNTAPLLVRSGYLDTAGNVAPYPDACYGPSDATAATTCLKQHGIVHAFVDYQPVSRLTSFHLIELGCYLVLTAIALITVGLLLRNRRAG
jgi:hypothetical protein